MAAFATLLGLGAASAATRLMVERQADGVAVSEAGKPLAFYRSKPGPAPAEPWRTHYLHPLFAPDGKVLTEDRPQDHLHQRGVFWAWRRILKDGAQVGDTWVMKDIAFAYDDLRSARSADGAVEITARLTWLNGASATPLIAATSVLRFEPLARDGSRAVRIRTGLTALQDGVALAGTDDDKGYSGFSIRFVRPDMMSFESGGRPLTAALGAVETGDTVTFGWPAEAGLPAWQVNVACAVDGKPVRQWVLRRELSMQNCAWPGRTPASLPKGKAVQLSAEMVIRPRPS